MFYHTPSAGPFASTFFNRTIDITEVPPLVDLQGLFLLVALLGLLGALGALAVSPLPPLWVSEVLSLPGPCMHHVFLPASCQPLTAWLLALKRSTHWCWRSSLLSYWHAKGKMACQYHSPCCRR